VIRTQKALEKPAMMQSQIERKSKSNVLLSLQRLKVLEFLGQKMAKRQIRKFGSSL